MFKQESIELVTVLTLIKQTANIHVVVIFFSSVKFYSSFVFGYGNVW